MPTEDEIRKAANRWFSRVGKAVREAGSAAKRAGKQVTGAGRGNVRVALDRMRFAPGEELRGTVALALTEPITAKRLVVALRASQRTVEYSRSAGTRAVGTTSATVYQFENELGGNRTYDNEQLEFSLAIPKDAADSKPPAPSGTIGDVARAVSSVVAPTTGPIEWRVTATLIIPWGRDLEHTVDIVVG